MFDEDERFVTSDFISEDAEIEVGLRPRNLSEYIGPVSYTHLTLPTN